MAHARLSDGSSAFPMCAIASAIRFLCLVIGIAQLAAPAQAQTIVNTARIQWSVGATQIARDSNQVSFEVEQPPVLPPTLSTYRLTRAPGTQSLTVPATLCQSASGNVPVVLDGVFTGTPLTPASVETSRLRAGEPVIISITSAADNQNSSSTDTIAVRVNGSNGDLETITLSETGVNSAVFVGIVRTRAAPPAPVPGDCVLSLQPDSSFTLSGLRNSDGSVIASAPVEVLIDPFGIVFDSGDGAPVAGSRVTIIDADTGQPAQVFGDDGRSAFPATIVTGSTVTDGGGQSYVFPPGDYRFPFVRAGRYRLVVEPPPPYSWPSASTPADLANLRRPDGPPFTIVDGSYGAIFT